jgi:hypothetical protein
MVTDMSRFSDDQLRSFNDRSSDLRMNSENSLQKTLYKWSYAAARDIARQEMEAEFPEAARLLADPTVRQQFKELFGPDATKYNVIADFFASDVIDIAHRIESDRRSHHFAINQLDAMLERTNVTLGNMSWAAETEANFNVADKNSFWSQRGKLEELY